MIDTTTRFLLQDMRALLLRIEWGGDGPPDQCPACGKLRGVAPRERHRSGCKQQEQLRRIEAMLKGE